MDKSDTKPKTNNKPKDNSNKIKAFLKKNLIHIIVLLMLLIVLIVNFATSDKKPTKDVLVAGKKLIAGEKIDKDSLQVLTIPADTKINGILDVNLKDRVIGLYTSNNLEIGDLVLQHNLFANKADLAKVELSNKDSKKIYVSKDSLAFLPANVAPGTIVSIYAADLKTNLNNILLPAARVVEVDETNKEPQFIGLELTDKEILTLNQALANKYYLQITINQ